MTFPMTLSGRDMSFQQSSSEQFSQKCCIYCARYRLRWSDVVCEVRIVIFHRKYRSRLFEVTYAHDA